MRINFSIVAKIFLGCAIYLITVSPTQVLASENSLNSLITNVYISANSPARISYELQIHNLDVRYIDYLKFIIPYSKISSVSATLDSRPVIFNTISDKSETVLEFELKSRAIPPQQKGVIRIEATMNDPISKYSDYSKFKYNNISTRFTLSSNSVNIFFLDGNYPSYVSEIFKEDLSQKKYQFTNPQDFELVWTSQATRSYSLDLTSNSGDYISFNLPLRTSNQEVSYQNISGAEFVGRRESDSSNWGFLAPDRSAQVRFKLDRSDNLGLFIPKLSRCAPGITLPADLDQISQPALISNYIYNNFSVDFDRFTLSSSNIGNPNPEQKSTLTWNEFYCMLQSYLDLKGIVSQIQYGYLSYDGFSDLDSSLPISWLVVESDDGFYTFNPLISYKMGIRSDNIPESWYIRMGWYDPDFQADSMLGMLSGSPIYRPQKVDSVQLSSGTDVEYEYQFPDSAYSGEFLQGRIVISNYTDRLLDINKVEIDNNDYTAAATRIYPGFSQVLIPGQNVLSIDFLREPNFLESSTKVHRVSVELDEPESGFTGEFTIRYTPDPRLIIFGAGLIIVTLIIISIQLMIYIKRVDKAQRNTILGKTKSKGKSQIESIEQSPVQMSSSHHSDKVNQVVRIKDIF